MDLNNISILNILPPNIAEDRNVKMTAEAFDKALRDIIKKIPGVAIIKDLALNQIVNETLMDLLAWQFHVDFYDPALPINIKRELVMKSLDWHCRKGTPAVVEEIVSTVFSKAKIEEWYEYEGNPYCFRVATAEEMPDQETITKLIRAINSVKNTRSLLETLTSLIVFREEIEIKESQNMTLSKKLKDDFSNQGKLFFNGRILYDTRTDRGYELGYVHYNGDFIFNGTLNFTHKRKKSTGNLRKPFLFNSGGGLRDTLAVSISTKAVTDKASARVFANRSIRFDGSECFSARGRKSVYDKARIWIKKHRFFNGVHQYGRAINFDSNILIPLE